MMIVNIKIKTEKALITSLSYTDYPTTSHSIIWFLKTIFQWLSENTEYTFSKKYGYVSLICLKVNKFKTSLKS